MYVYARQPSFAPRPAAADMCYDDGAAAWPPARGRLHTEANGQLVPAYLRVLMPEDPRRFFTLYVAHAYAARTDKANRAVGECMHDGYGYESLVALPALAALALVPPSSVPCVGSFLVLPEACIPLPPKQAQPRHRPQCIHLREGGIDLRLFCTSTTAYRVYLSDRMVLRGGTT
jgi:hypothetical protein